MRSATMTVRAWSTGAFRRLRQAFLMLGAGLMTQGMVIAAEERQPFIPTSTKREYLTGGTSLYQQDRERLVNQHVQQRFCATEPLSESERALDRRLRALITPQLRKYPTEPFFLSKTKIEQTETFRFLKAMPKGGLLHVHLAAVGRMDWILTNALTLPNCYVKGSPPDAGWGALKFYSSDTRAARDGYRPVATLARESPDFTAQLRARLTLGPEDYLQGKVWDEFGTIFQRLHDFVRHQAVFTNYLFDAFQRLWDDGVYHVELRDALPELTELDGRSAPLGAAARGLLETRRRMQQLHPEFDCRLILTSVRVESGTNIVKGLEKAVQLRRDYPDLIVGFDLIASEDLDRGTTEEKVLDVLPQLQNLQYILAQNPDAVNEPQFDVLKKLAETPGNPPGQGDLPYYLHDGESAWADNDNLFDAILLQAPRIGHGFNLFRYPSLYPALIARSTALEICPISNQLLNLTPDLRIHPASGYLNAGIQCVLASDDPALFGNDGLSYDFWQALMAWNLDLAALKKLARNSIRHSALPPENQARLEQFWTTQWDRFIEQQLATFAETSSLH